MASAPTKRAVQRIATRLSILSNSQGSQKIHPGDLHPTIYFFLFGSSSP